MHEVLRSKVYDLLCQKFLINPLRLLHYNLSYVNCLQYFNQFDLGMLCVETLSVTTKSLISNP